jgi:hypothetical protein
MRWHEWLFQPSVSPAATSSIGVPRWPATSHTGASLQHCTSIIFLRLVRYWPSLPRSALLTPSGVAWVARHHPSLPLARHWPSLWEASLRHSCRHWVRSETQDPGVPVGHSFTSSLPSQPRLAGGPGDSTGSRLCLSTPMGVARITVGWLRETVFPFRRCSYPEPAHLSDIPLTSPLLPVSTELTTSADHPTPALNAQNHTETSLALQPSCGETVLDSMCCVAIAGPGGGPIETPWCSCNTGRSSSPCKSTSVWQSHFINLPKNLVPNLTATRLFEHEPTHMAWCMQLDMLIAVGVHRPVVAAHCPLLPSKSPVGVRALPQYERFNASSSHVQGTP